MIGEEVVGLVIAIMFTLLLTVVFIGAGIAKHMQMKAHIELSRTANRLVLEYMEEYLNGNNNPSESA